MDSLKAERLTISLIIGILVVFVQWLLVFKVVSIGPEAIDSALHVVVVSLMIPGFIVAIAVAGSVHVFSPTIVLATNLVVYSALIYWTLAFRARRQSKHALVPKSDPEDEPGTYT